MTPLRSFWVAGMRARICVAKSMPSLLAVLQEHAPEIAVARRERPDDWAAVKGEIERRIASL